MGRKLQYPERFNLALAEGMAEKLDAVRFDGESRLDVIRVAIDREIKRRGEPKTLAKDVGKPGRRTR